LLKCANCNAASASRLPTKEALDRYYQGYYKTSFFLGREERTTFDRPQRFGRHLARRLREHLTRPTMRIIDFGGGDGSVAVSTAEQLLDAGLDRAELTIVEYNKELIRVDDERISLEHQSSIDNLPLRHYDFVIASAVLEHIPRPRQMLIRLLNLLRRDGIFYARTPCVVPFVKLLRHLGVKWDFTFPAHIHDLDQEFWESLFNEAVFKRHFAVLESGPAIVETCFRDHFLTTLASHVSKAPWYVLGKRYGFVGAWELFVRKGSDAILAYPEDTTLSA